MNKIARYDICAYGMSQQLNGRYVTYNDHVDEVARLNTLLDKYKITDETKFIMTYKYIDSSEVFSLCDSLEGIKKKLDNLNESKKIDGVRIGQVVEVPIEFEVKASIKL